MLTSSEFPDSTSNTRRTFLPDTQLPIEVFWYPYSESPANAEINQKAGLTMGWTHFDSLELSPDTQKFVGDRACLN